MNFILLLMFIYLYLKYRDMSKDMNNYIVRLENLEDLMEDNKNVEGEE